MALVLKHINPRIKVSGTLYAVSLRLKLDW